MSRQTFNRDSLPRRLDWRADESIADVERRLRDWVRDVERHLAQIPPFEVITVDFIGGSTNFDVATEVTPIAVQVGGILLSATPGAALALTTSLDWIRTIGGFRVRSIQGLTSGARYRITFVVNGEIS